MIRAGAKNHEFVTVVTDPMIIQNLFHKLIIMEKLNTHTENILPQRHLN